MRNIKIRDTRIKEKYYIDDIYLNGWAKIIKPPGTAIYNSLCRHADINQSSFPSIKVLAKEHGISEKTAKRAIKKLQKYNIIKIERVRNEKGKWLNNLYYLLDKSAWVKLSMGQNDPMDIQGSKTTLSMGQNDPLKDTHIKDTHKENTKKKNQQEIQVTPQYIAELQKKYPKINIKALWEQRWDWILSKGYQKKYKNWQAFLRNQVRREIEHLNENVYADIQFDNPEF